MNKRPWCIWFSLLAFAILCADTMWRALYYKKMPFEPLKTNSGVNLWLRVIGEIFFNAGIVIMVPMILLLNLFGYLGNRVPELIRLLQVVQLLILYVLGVYAAYRLIVWRRANISQ